MRLRRVRRSLYRGARILGDVQAIEKVLMADAGSGGSGG
jgi:hypothetical protein